MFLKIVTLFFLLISAVYAEESKPVQTYQDLNEIMSKIEKSEVETFPQKILDFRKSFSVFIEMKKKVCKGEYSTIIFQDKITGVEENRKVLSGEEKKICLKELKLYQRDTILKLFQFRKLYLEYSHKKLMEELEVVKEQTIKNLDLVN